MEEENENLNDENAAENAECENSEESAATGENKVAELEKQVSELKNDYLRKCADFENFRKRMAKEKQDAFDYATSVLLSDLIEVLDNFDRCVESAESATDAKTVAQGVQMVSAQLFSLLESKHGLAVYGKTGDAFDPNFHEALASENSPDVEQPTCAEIYLKGYKLHDRVLRAAKVRVKMPATQDAQNEGAAQNQAAE